MTSKTSQTKKSKKKATPRKKASLTFSRKELFLWLGVVFLTMVWMFILGVIVGRGLSPVRFDVEKLQHELIALKEQALKAKADAVGTETGADDRHLGFYDILTEKKEMARLKSMESPPSVAKKKTERTIATLKSTTESKTEKAPPSAKREDRAVATAAEAPPTSVGYTLQIASFRDTERADDFVSTLASKGYDAYQVAAHVHGKGIYHRVRVGHFRTKQEAEGLLARLREDNLNPLLIQK